MKSLLTFAIFQQLEEKLKPKPKPKTEKLAKASADQGKARQGRQGGRETGEGVGGQGNKLVLDVYNKVKGGEELAAKATGGSSAMALPSKGLAAS